MSDEEARIEARLRGMLRGVDTRPGFEARVMARVRALPAAPAAELRALYERRREGVRRRLRRETWSNLATVVGVGAAAMALVWQHAGEIVRWAEAGGIAGLQPWLLAGGMAAAICGAAWPFVRRFMPAAL